MLMFAEMGPEPKPHDSVLCFSLATIQLLSLCSRLTEDFSLSHLILVILPWAGEGVGAGRALTSTWSMLSHCKEPFEMCFLLLAPAPCWPISSFHFSFGMARF